MQNTPQPESCIDGLWKDAQAEANACGDFLNGIPDMQQYLLNYPFKADTGEIGVRRIDGCFPLQRSVWLRDAVNNKEGVNCWERTRSFLAKNILIFGLPKTQESYRVMDVLLTSEIRHVFPLASDGTWVILNEGERTLAETITGGTGKFNMNPPPANATTQETQVEEDPFANDPLINGVRRISSDIVSKVEEWDKALPANSGHSDAITYVDHDDVKKVMEHNFGPALAYHVLDKSGRSKFMIPTNAILRRANYGEEDNPTQNIGGAVASALDPLINRGAATFAQNLKNEQGYLPIETKISVDPLLIFGGVAVAGLISAAIISSSKKKNKG